MTSKSTAAAIFTGALVFVVIVLLRGIVHCQPTSVTITTGTPRGLQLNWTADTNPAVTSYRIGRGNSSGTEDWVNLLAVIAAAAVTYTDDTGFDGQPFYYEIESCVTPGVAGGQYRKYWASTTPYSVGNVVSYNSVGYTALIASTGKQPDTNPTYWAVTPTTCSSPSAEVNANYPTTGYPTVNLPIGMSLSGSSYIGTTIDTTYSLPAGGTTWTEGSNCTGVQGCLNSANPGDVVILHAGTVYSGNFNVPSKANPSHKWIYVLSSTNSSLPAPGTRINPATDAANMPKIITPNTTAPLTFQSGANYWRFAGIEIYNNSATHFGSNAAFYSYFLVTTTNNPTTLPDRITFDRCYLHGTPTQDIQHGLSMIGTNYAVIESDISQIHWIGPSSGGGTVDVQAVSVYNTPGPIKIYDNNLVAATENVEVGGSGNNVQLCDVQVQKNDTSKDLSWIGLNQAIKNGIEFKGGCRVLVDSNNISNVWFGGQNGPAVVLTIRPSGGGSYGLYDVTVTNNLMTNVIMQVNFLSADYYCGTTSYPNCTNAGRAYNVLVKNNFAFIWDSTQPGYYFHTGQTQFNGGFDNTGIAYDTVPAHNYVPLSNVIFEHNGAVAPAGQSCWASSYSSGTGTPAIPTGLMNNVWLRNNNLCTQPWGDSGIKYSVWSQYPTAAPNGYANRMTGNMMWVQSSGTPLQTWPANNTATHTVFTYNASNVLTGPTPFPTTTDSLTPGFLGVGFTAPLTYNSPTSLANGTQGTAYTTTPVVCGGGTAPYTCTSVGSALPAGLSLSGCSPGLNGTPSGSGSFSGIQLQCADSATPTPATALSPLMTLSISGTSTLTYVSPASLANGTQGVSYGPVCTVATGGVLPYSYSLVSGTLPLGMTYSGGCFSGTPTVGTYPGIITQVTDSSLPPATVPSPALSLTINPSPPVLGVSVSQGVSAGQKVVIH